MKIRRLLVGAGTAAVLASTALIGTTAGTAHAALTCEQLENARVGAVAAHNYNYDAWLYYELRGDATSAGYYYVQSEFWHGRVVYLVRNLRNC